MFRTRSRLRRVLCWGAVIAVTVACMLASSHWTTLSTPRAQRVLCLRRGSLQLAAASFPTRPHRHGWLFNAAQPCMITFHGSWWRPAIYRGTIAAGGQPPISLAVVHIPMWPGWMLAASGIAGLLWKTRPSVVPGHCAACGYDLRRVPAGRCPECGTGFNAGSRYAGSASRAGSPRRTEPNRCWHFMRVHS